MYRSPEAGAGNLLRVVAFGWTANLEMRVRNGSVLGEEGQEPG